MYAPWHKNDPWLGPGMDPWLGPLREIEILITSSSSLSDVSEALSKLDKKTIERQQTDIHSTHYKWDLLHFAIYAKRVDVVEYMIKKDLFQVPRSWFDAAKLLPHLHIACICGNVEIFELIMLHRPREKGLDINRQSLQWTTFLDTMRKGITLMIFHQFPRLKQVNFGKYTASQIIKKITF